MAIQYELGHNKTCIQYYEWGRNKHIINCPQLHSYAVNRDPTEGLIIDPENVGYSIYCNRSTNGTSAIYDVVQYKDYYNHNLILTSVSLGALLVFITLAGPILLILYKDELYTNAKENTNNFLYIIWSLATLCFTGTYMICFLMLGYHVECWVKPHYDAHYKNIYNYFIAIFSLVHILDLIIAIPIVLLAGYNDFPVPDLIRYITCHFSKCRCIGKEKKNTYCIQIVAVWHTLSMVQLLTFHIVPIFLAFVATPLHTALVMIFYAATVFSLFTTIMLIYATFNIGDRVNKKTLKKVFLKGLVKYSVLAITFLCLLFTVIFLGFSFLRITIFVGEQESSRVTGLIGSLLPTALIAGLGIIAKKLLPKEESRKKDVEKTADKRVHHLFKLLKSLASEIDEDVEKQHDYYTKNIEVDTKDSTV